MNRRKSLAAPCSPMAHGWSAPKPPGGCRRLLAILLNTAKKGGRFAPPRKKRPPRRRMHQMPPLFSTNLEYTRTQGTYKRALEKTNLVLSCPSRRTWNGAEEIDVKVIQPILIVILCLGKCLLRPYFITRHSRVV